MGTYGNGADWVNRDMHYCIEEAAAGWVLETATSCIVCDRLGRRAAFVTALVAWQASLDGLLTAGTVVAQGAKSTANGVRIVIIRAFEGHQMTWLCLGAGCQLVLAGTRGRAKAHETSGIAIGRRQTLEC